MKLPIAVLALAAAAAAPAAESLAAVQARIDKSAAEFQSLTAKVKKVSYTAVIKDQSSETGTFTIKKVKVGDVRVRNVPTNIRDWQGGADEFGNSIFIFEMGGLCIAHLGHLHDTLSDKQLAQIGQMDVVLVPVDGSYTLDLPGLTYTDTTCSGLDPIQFKANAQDLHALLYGEIPGHAGPSGNCGTSGRA